MFTDSTLPRRTRKDLPAHQLSRDQTNRVRLRPGKGQLGIDGLRRMKLFVAVLIGWVREPFLITQRWHRARPAARGPRWIFILAGLALLFGCVSPTVVMAHGRFAASRRARTSPECHAARRGHAECLSARASAVSVTSPDAVGPAYEGSGEYGGYAPVDLRSAYKLPETGGSGQTVAIVDAYNDPNAYPDLKTYRSKYKLPECTEASGCFKKVNQKGEVSNYPANSKEWSGEISLDLDMVSATCPECHILLVEATDTSFTNLGEAEDEAATLGATVISNSYGAPEEPVDATAYGAYYEHAGIPITVAAGDSGYGVGFPAGSPHVISVGGTALKREATSARGWAEEVWRNTEKKAGERFSGTGSGCALEEETKPSWQNDTGCKDRTDNDIAAVASGTTPVSVYDTYEEGGWGNRYGTSAAAPIVAGIEGLAQKPAKALGAEIFYDQPNSEFEVTKGSDGTCTPPSEDEYLCTARKGYNGPAGMGAPDGVPSVATTGAATGISETEATVHGAVSPEGVETKYYFEYGTTESYGSKTAEASAGAGKSGVEVSKTIAGLSPGTKYYYRIVATNADGTAYGADQTFATTSEELYVAAEGPGNRMYSTVRGPTGFWQGPYAMDGEDTTYSTPSEIFDSAGDLYVVAEGPGHRLYETERLSEGHWIGPYAIDGENTTYSTPALAFDSAGNLFVTAEGPGHRLYETERLSEGHWIGPYAIDGENTTYSATAEAFDHAGNLFVTAEGPGHRLYETERLSEGHWIGPYAIDGENTTYSTPALAFDSAGNLFVTAEGPGHRLYETERLSEGHWIGPYAIDGENTTYSATAEAFDHAGNLFVTAEGPGHRLYETERLSEGHWIGPYAIDGENTTYSRPAVAFDPAGDMYVVAEGPGRRLYETERLSEGHWIGPYAIDGENTTYSSPSEVFDPLG